jgi:hypothetical protein
MGRLGKNGPALSVSAGKRPGLRPATELDNGSCAANGAIRFVSTVPDRMLPAA